MFAIEVQSSFHASHALRLPGGGMEPVHAHTFHVTARLGAERLYALETVIDFHVVEELLQQIVMIWQNRYINDQEPFKLIVNPSAERLAEFIGQRLQTALQGLQDSWSRHLRLMEIRLTEAPGCLAIWSPDQSPRAC